MAESFNVGDAYIELRLRQEKLRRDADQTAQTLKQQEARLQGVAEKAEQAGNKSNDAFQGLVGTALKAVAVMGTLELGIAAVNVASDAFSGNIEDAAEGVKRLPAGIGPVATQTESLLGTVTGITAEIERIEAVNNAINAAIDRQRTSAEKIADIERDRVKTLSDLADELERLQADPQDRTFLAARQGIEARVKAAREELELAKKKQAITDEDRAAIREIQEQIRDVGTGQFTADQLDSPEAKNRRAQVAFLRSSERRIRDAAVAEKEAAVQAAQERLEAVLAVAEALNEDINREEREAAEERLKIAEREAQDRAKIAEREAEKRRRDSEKELEQRKREMAEAIAQFDREQSLTSELIQKQLLLQGRDLEAQIESIVQGAFEAQGKAKTSAEADLITKNRNLDIQAAIRDAEKQLNGGATAAPRITSIESAVASLQDAALQREDPSLNVMKEQLAVAKDQAAKLGVIAEEAKKQQAQLPAMKR